MTHRRVVDDQRRSRFGTKSQLPFKPLERRRVGYAEGKLYRNVTSQLTPRDMTSHCTTCHDVTPRGMTSHQVQGGKGE